ncbi:hypothetical protein, partial [Limnospira sp. Paracas R14]|uniref:hypothetical protein n=1 Tax=Limnospira sp. Paracas R14 TaxID=2981108 RepID=UPI0028E0BEE7|nr:hypothetical protein [Limnospira sp. Paracas R14]
RKLGEFPENGKSPVGRVTQISPTHITVSGLSWKCGGFQESEVGRVSRKGKVTSCESFPKRESHQLGELLSYHLPT